MQTFSSFQEISGKRMFIKIDIHHKITKQLELSYVSKEAVIVQIISLTSSAIDALQYCVLFSARLSIVHA